MTRSRGNKKIHFKKWGSAQTTSCSNLSNLPGLAGPTRKIFGSSPVKSKTVEGSVTGRIPASIKRFGFLDNSAKVAKILLLSRACAWPTRLVEVAVNG